jgi:hypothetical protein
VLLQTAAGVDITNTGLRFNVITTSSEEAVQGELVIVHLSVYVLPATPLNVEVALESVVIVPPVPDTIDHAPVPAVGVLPAKVTEVKPQVAVLVWSGPAFAVVGLRLNVITTSSEEEAQGELVIVHLSVYVLPATPLNAEVALEGVVIVPPVPDTIDHAPVPTVAALPANVTEVKPHVVLPFWSGPALAVVGLRLNVIITSSDAAVQGELLTVQRKV